MLKTGRQRNINSLTFNIVSKALKPVYDNASCLIRRLQLRSSCWTTAETLNRELQFKKIELEENQ